MLLKELTYLKTKLDRLYQPIQGLGYLYEQVQMHWWQFKGWDWAGGGSSVFH